MHEVGIVKKFGWPRAGAINDQDYGLVYWALQIESFVTELEIEHNERMKKELS